MTVLSVRGLELDVGTRRLISDVNLTVHAGELVGVTGANGVGKSTLLRLLAGLSPESDAVGYGPAVTDRPGGVRNGIGYAPAHLDAPGRLTVGEYVAMLAAARGLCDTDTGGLISALNADAVWDSMIEVLSTGERTKVAIVAALLHRPALGVFDEPFEGLDEDSAARARHVLRTFVSRGGAAVVCTHRHRFLGGATRVVTIIGGRMVDRGVPCSRAHDASRP